MLTVETAADLAVHAGQVMGYSEWCRITQEMIRGFSELTGDDHWIHIDVERAARDMPDGKIIAHGLLLVSLIPRLQREIYTIRQRGRGLNYGYDRIRFTAPVPVDSNVRLRQTLVEATPHKAGTRIVTEAEIAREGAERPAVVARNILLIEDPA